MESEQRGPDSFYQPFPLNSCTDSCEEPYKVHVNQIREWKKRVLEETSGLFSRKKEKNQAETEELIAELYRQIGQLKVELDWVKKKSNPFH